MGYKIIDTWSYGSIFKRPTHKFKPDYSYKVQTHDVKYDVAIVTDLSASPGKNKLTYGLTLKGNVHVQFLLTHFPGVVNLSQRRVRDNEFTYIHGEVVFYVKKSCPVYLDFFTRDLVTMKNPSWAIMRNWKS